MNRRQFLKSTSVGVSSLLLATHSVVTASTTDHPNTILVSAQSSDLSVALQNAFMQAYQLWEQDPLSRRPVIQIPAGNFVIDDIPGNNKGNYPFHMPPTFKLIGAGKANTSISCVQTSNNQYRFLMVMPNTRLDVINACSTLDEQCVTSTVSQLGPSYNVEISGITFNDFDFAIGFKEARDCYVHDCDFNGSIVAVQLTIGHQFGNKNHRFENCAFDAMRQDGSALKFCLRFEAPFANVLTRTETGVQSQQACIALGGDANDYSQADQTCTVPDDAQINAYLTTLFGIDGSADVTNRDCLITHCDFSNSAYSAIECAGKSNVHNTISFCGFTDCEGTGVEFDKGASFNTVEHCVFSGMKPATIFAPAQPYVFQAAVQEQEGSRSVDARIKSYITEMGFSDPQSTHFRGTDIFLRAASLPQNNLIQSNQFDISRSYWLSDYESNTSKHSQLPDVYPSIKLSASLNTKVINNNEFISNAALEVDDSSVMGQSIGIYQNDNLRDNCGGIEIRQNQFHGAWFIIGTENGKTDTLPLVVENNEFGMNTANPRGGFSLMHCYADSVVIRNNKFRCANYGSSAIFRLFEIGDLNIDGNTFDVPVANSIYIVSKAASGYRSNTTRFENNLIDGSQTLYLYDYSGTPNAAITNDHLKFNYNRIANMSGTARVLAVTLWVKNIEINSNEFDNIEDKVFQIYALSDSLSHDGNNTLNLGANSQDRVYSRNYLNTSGAYITSTFWL